MRRLCAITIDLHSSDSPADIAESHAALARMGCVATYFLPTALLEDARFREALRAIDDGRTEIGTHGHRHDVIEIASLSGNGGGSLAFLERSAELYADHFRRRPRAFRAPQWCNLAERAVDALSELGYRVDSSSTPQRIGLLSSYPFENPWLLSPRRPTFLRPGLLEVPTSSFIVPFGGLSLAAFRKWGGLAFAGGFAVEALLTGRIVTIQLHPAELVASGKPPVRQRSIRDFMPVHGRGFGVRHWCLDEHPGRMRGRVLAVLGLFERMRFETMTLSGIYDYVAGSARPESGPKVVSELAIPR